MNDSCGASRPADTAALQPCAPRVCVALRWREPRASLSLPSAAAADELEEVRVSQRDRIGSTHGIDTDAPASRLSVLRRRLPSHNVPSTVIVGLGMRAVASASPSAMMEETVQTPLLAVEGLEASAAAGVAVNDHDTASSHHGQTAVPGPSPALPSYTDASLTTRLADLIADELLPRRADAASPPPRLSSTPDGASQSREVLTFTLGPQGSANTTFLFGGALGWTAPATLPPPSPPPSLTASRPRGLVHAVLKCLFAPGRVPRGTHAVVALSVTEVRDATPLCHPSLLQRPRATVDLLSGSRLRTEGGASGESSGMRGKSESDEDGEGDRPTDIPAACYVRVASAPEAMAVLYAALASSLGWAKCEESPNTSPPLLRPLSESLEERPCHVCVTMIVSCEPLSVPLQQGRHQTQGTAPRATTAVTGLWKLWDLASPSITCGYRPLASAVDDAQSAAVAELPWSSRYSLAALTQTCLAEASRDVRAASAAAPLLRRDRSAALPILASASDSCSLVVPLCTVVADAALDEVNAEVLRTAAAWAAYGQGDKRRNRGQERQRCDAAVRLCGLENAEAAQRVVSEYAVPFAEFVADLYPVRPSTATSPDVLERPRGSEGAADGGRLGGATTLNAHGSLESSPLPALHSHTDVHARVTRRSVSTYTDDCDIGVGAPLKPPASAMQPLSINVTHNGDDAVGVGRQRATEAHLEPGPSAVSDYSPSRRSAALVVAGAANTGRDQCGGVVSGSPPPPPPPPQQPAALAPAAQLAAAAAVHAEEERLRRFQALFETDSLFHDASASPEATYSAPVVAAADAHRGLAATTVAQTPSARDRSPPSVLSTGPRREGRAVRQILLDSSHDPTVDGAHGSEVSAAMCLSALDARHNTSGGPSRYPPQVLQHHTLMASTEGAASAITGVFPEAVRTDARLAGVGDAAAPRERPDADAALAAFLAPYCDEFVRLHAAMQADVRAWRAEEAAALAELSTLAARHTHDIEAMAALHRRLVDSTAAEVTAQTSSTTPGFPTVERGVVLSGGAGDTASCSSTFASTSTLIFEQLVRSEEKVAWLERQLVDWRRRAHEASVLDTSSNLVDDPTVAATATGSSVLISSKEDPTKHHLQAAQALLERLLQRCARTYGAAQQRSDRRHEQLAQEQASSSALRQRIVELEAELVGLRVRGGTSPPWDSASANPGLAAVEAQGAGTCTVVRDLTTVSRGKSDALVAATTTPLPLVDEFEVARSSLTVAPVSPIASDTASSLPSSFAASATRSQRRHVEGLSQGTPRDEALGRLPVDSHEPRSLQAPMPSQQQQLAALLSRAVLGGRVGGPAPDSTAVTEHAGRGEHGRWTPGPASTVPLSSLFEVHLGAGSADSRADVISRSDSEDVDSDGGVPQPVPSAPHSSPQPHERKEEEEEDRGHASLRSPQATWRLVPTTATPSEAAPRETRGALWSGGGDVEHVAGALARRTRDASYGAVGARRGGNAAEGDEYPSPALEALGQAAAQLERDAARLGSSSSNSAAVSSPSPRDAASAVASSHGQRFSGGGRAAWSTAAAATAELHDVTAAQESRLRSAVTAPLSDSMSRLRAATQAVQREARDAAERERAYLSAVLFAEPRAAATR